MEPLARRDGDFVVLPGLATAHSHAFQRALRARTQQRAGSGSFWSWRASMYELASTLDPTSIYELSRDAYRELALSGVTAVGEFHYVHHTPSGAPYDDRIALADAVVRAAREVGLRIALLRVFYERAGWGRAAEPAQRRFCDARLDEGLADVLALRDRFQSDPFVRVGVAPHSLRAVTLASLVELRRFARTESMPFHMHVSEQRREVQECIAEHGRRPVELLADSGLLDERFVAVHATHLSRGEARLLGDARSSVCLCRTTERDLGDGLPDVTALVDAGVRLCTGADSHASSDPFEEARAIELDERARVEARQVACDGRALLYAATRAGYEAIGFGDAWSEDRVVLSSADPSLAAVPDELLDDAIVFSASPRAVRETYVAGRRLSTS